MPKTKPPIKLPKNPPLTKNEMVVIENERSDNKLNKNVTDELTRMTECIRRDLQTKREKLSLVGGDLKKIQAQVFEYLKTCEEFQNVPTIQGIARCLGHHRNSLYKFLDTYPDTDISRFLEQVRDAVSEIYDLAGMKNAVNPVYAIFTQKSLFGRFDKAELYVNPSTAINQLGEVPSFEEIQRRYLPESAD